MKNRNLQTITQIEAEKFVMEDLAKFSDLYGDDKCLLIFNKTQNLYHRSSRSPTDRNYHLLKENFNGQGK